MFYFAYGSNLSHKQMSQRCPDAKASVSATLHHYRLIFCGWSRTWHGGTASIKAQRDRRVFGGLYKMSDSCQRKLDRYEGYPATYDKINIIVNTDASEAIEAFTYIKKQQSEETKPSPEYLKIIKQGYIDWGLV